MRVPGCLYLRDAAGTFAKAVVRSGRSGRYVVKQILTTLVMAVGLLVVPATGHAHDAYDDTQSNPLRLVAYALNPAGYAIEWLVMRPIHFVVSQPKLERVFGHTPHETPFGDYQPYDADDAY
jgi:hypothetical protein